MRLSFIFGRAGLRALLFLPLLLPWAHGKEEVGKDPAEVRLEELQTRLRGLMKELDPTVSRLADLREGYADLGKLNRLIERRPLIRGEVERLREDFISAREEFHALGQAQRDVKVMAGLGQLMSGAQASSMPGAYAYWTAIEEFERFARQP